METTSRATSNTDEKIPLELLLCSLCEQEDWLSDPLEAS
jgi:hypothetical protein